MFIGDEGGIEKKKMDELDEVDEVDEVDEMEASLAKKRRRYCAQNWKREEVM